MRAVWNTIRPLSNIILDDTKKKASLTCLIGKLKVKFLVLL